MGIEINLKIILKGGITLAGIVAMATAAILDVVTNTPNKFQTLFWIGFGAFALGSFLIWKLGHD